MKRAHRVGLILTIFSTLYLLAFLQIPWWLLVTFGSYSLWSLGWGIFTFRDCPEAYTELLAEITQAKDDLRARGVTVD